MARKELTQTPEVQQLLDIVSGATSAAGDPRTKQILRRIVADLFATIEEFAITPEEFWATLGFLQGGAAEFGLIAPGLGFDRFLDMRMDEADKTAGVTGVTPRAIEGPLYVPGAPLSKGFARLDDGADQGRLLIMAGTVRDEAGKPIAGAIVDVWCANTLGRYSYFDAAQEPYNNRRRIETEADGRYKFRGMVPCGYAVPPQGVTERLMRAVGRHGQRPAHIHFFVSAPNYRHLTTQINIADDPYLHDDFAHATREELIPAIIERQEVEAIRREGLDGPFAQIAFDFTLPRARSPHEPQLPARPRVPVSS
jgi:catechol 1,2-dioxygenase